MDMRFGTWNVRSLNRTKALGLVTSKYRMDLIGIQEIRWEGTLESGTYILFYGKGNAKAQLTSH
jgi:Endonuclease/Exonuclease/phosphatase family.